ncbi:MAG: hypothetical protein ABIF11_03465 [Nitrospirota bacterium]
MMDLKGLWGNTKNQFYELEGELIKLYISFLRKVAENYIKEGRSVFFRENTVVHWGEGNFGSLIIEGEEDVIDEFGDYITEIRFERDIAEKETRGYQKIVMDSLHKITYRQEIKC